MSEAITDMSDHEVARVPAHTGVYYGWYILGIFWLVLATNLAFPMYGAGIINTYMAEALQLNAQELGLSFSIYMAMLGLPAPLIAMAIARFGLRPAFALGSLMIAGGSLAMATLVNGPVGAAIAFGVFVALGIATGANIATQIGIGRWFVRRRSLALSIMFSANGVGGLFAPPLLNSAITHSGDWRTGWWIIGLMALCVGAIATLVVRERPEDVGQRPDGGGSDQPAAAAGAARVYITSESFTLRQAVRSAAFAMILVAIMANFAGLSLVLSHGVPNLRSLGHDPASAALAVSLISGGTLAGKLLLGIQGDRIEPRLLWAVASCLVGIGLLFAPHATDMTKLVLYAAPFGIGFGGALVVQTALMLNYFGVRIFGAIIGLALFGQTFLGALTPILAGWLHDRLGSYLIAFTLAGMANLVAALVLLMLRPPRLQYLKKMDDEETQGQ
jgi:MFS family permease